MRRRGSQVATAPAEKIVPTGRLLKLSPEDVRANANNPRMLFDPQPLHELKENIRLHGVLVPITVYPLPGQRKYGILDGARRHRCCLDLQSEGIDIRIPANIVEPPDKVAGLLYMFSIHNFREQWELMPTALSLRIVKEELGESDTKKLSHLTGLSEPQVERCKKLLEFSERFQALSLDPNPKTRIPSNFWIELHPVLSLCDRFLTQLEKEIGRDGIIDRLVQKYRAKKIKSVIHFRRIVEAFDFAADGEVNLGSVTRRLHDYITNPQLETRQAFDEFVVDTRRIQGAIAACESFMGQLQRAKLEHIIEREDLTAALEAVRDYTGRLLQQLAGSDPPIVISSDEEAEGSE